MTTTTDFDPQAQFEPDAAVAALLTAVSLDFSAVATLRKSTLHGDN